MAIGFDLGFNKQKSKSSGSRSGEKTGRRSEQLLLEDEAIAKIIEDVLGSAEGLSGIFSAEKSAGVYNSSVAQQGTSNLVASIVGELAKLTGRTETSTEEDFKERFSQKGKTSGFDGGLDFSIG